MTEKFCALSIKEVIEVEGGEISKISLRRNADVKKFSDYDIPYELQDLIENTLENTDCGTVQFSIERTYVIYLNKEVKKKNE